ncbi:MAG: oxidoreductase, partial [Mycobacteriaceae bacterium]
ASNPRVTYTKPEVAAVGVGVEQARRRGLIVRTQHHDDVDRAVTDGDTTGFSRLVLDRKDRVVGAAIVGPRAGESLAEAVLAVRRGLRARDLAGTTHAYPTYADGLWKPSVAAVDEQLHRGLAHRATTVLAALRGRWVRR